VERAVLVSDDGRAFIAEFDVSSETHDPGLSTRYSAPEILKKDNTRPTIAADMWSFGCVLYEVRSKSFQENNY
jgi:serine/threonine protein kinase